MSRPTLTGSESLAVTLTATAAVLVVGAYLLDCVGIAFPPARMLGIGVVCAGSLLAWYGRSAWWNGVETGTFCAIVAATWAWLLWMARPTFFPLGSGPDLTHHLLLVHFIEQHWTLVHDPGVQEYLGEMVQYTPGSHILTALAGAWSRSNGLHAMHAVMAASVALKSGFVFLIAIRVLPREIPRVPIALLASVSLFASPIYFLGSFARYSFLAQVMAECFAVAMWWALTVWQQTADRWAMPLAGLLGAAIFLTWPILIGPPLIVLGAFVVMPSERSLFTKITDALITVMPMVFVAVLFSIGRLRYVEIAGTGGDAMWPAVRAYGWPFLVASSVGILIAAAGKRARSVAFLAVAILLQAGGLYLFARWRGNDPYMMRKMFYMLLFPQAAGVAVAVGTLWCFTARRLRISADARSGPLAWALVLVEAIVVARPLIGAPGSLAIAKHPAASHQLEEAATWVLAHANPRCVEYLVGDDNTAYWLHLAALGNPRRGPRTADNATYELNPALLRWLTPGGFPYAIADLRDLPSHIRTGADVAATFGYAAVIKRSGPSSCPDQ